MGPRVPFAPAILILSLQIALHIYFISYRLFILLYVACVMVNKGVRKIEFEVISVNKISFRATIVL